MGAPRRRKGLIIVFTGSGKGKTTAALGTALRAIGHGMRVLMVQFIKGAWRYGELNVCEKLLNLEILPMGEGFTWVTKNRERDIQKAREAWNFAKEKIASGSYDIVILDEINYAINYGFLDANEVAEFLEQKPSMLHVILTGRNAHDKIIQIADLVTEMREVKHPYKSGIMAQRGIEY